jgi:hypothetical protein
LMSETPRSLTIDRAAGVMTPARRGTAAGRVPCARDIRASSRQESVVGTRANAVASSAQAQAQSSHKVCAICRACNFCQAARLDHNHDDAVRVRSARQRPVKQDP